jgi:hypothetical protein
LDGESARRKASTYTGQHNTEKRGHTSMPRVGFQLTILEEYNELDDKALKFETHYYQLSQIVCRLAGLKLDYSKHGSFHSGYLPVENFIRDLREQ